MKLEKATTGDIILSFVIPGWGLLVGLIALLKREYKRSITMVAISSVIIALYAGWQIRQQSQQRHQLAESQPLSIDAQLLASEAEVNRGSPQMVDDYTRLDGARAGPGLAFTYLYSFPEMPSGEIDPGTFQADFVPNIRRAACESNELSAFLEQQITLKFQYRGNDGLEIGSVIVDSAMCSAMAGAGGEY